MAVREVLVYPNPILKQVCSVADPQAYETCALAQDLIDTMYSSGHSVGIAAPQLVAFLDHTRTTGDRNHCLPYHH